jgi:nucleotide-binding universal stress UspA family protein
MRASGPEHRFGWVILERCRTDPAAPHESRVTWMFTKILVAIDDFGQSQAVLDLVKSVASDAAQVRALHLRERELSGYSWYSRESSGQASLVADAAVFEFRMAGLAAGGGVRHAVVDRVAEGILAEAREWDADLIVLGTPRRGEFTARLFGSVTQRVLQRSACPVIVAPRQARGRRKQLAAASSPRDHG